MYCTSSVATAAATVLSINCEAYADLAMIFLIILMIEDFFIQGREIILMVHEMLHYCGKINLLHILLFYSLFIWFSPLFAALYYSFDFCDFILLCSMSLFVFTSLCQVFFIKNFKIYNFYKVFMICPCFVDNLFQFYCLCPSCVDCFVYHLCLLLTFDFL